ncbi:MAG: ribbon-helix-helix domain-containing protein [Chloroflexota bacterium]
MTAAKVTLTLPDELLVVVDRFVAEHPGATRSGVCAEALREWLRARQEAEVADYYTTMSDEERAEDVAWALVAAQSAARLWP